MHRLRVLVADDHEGMRRMVTSLLSQNHVITGSVGDGKQLVDAATAYRPDVIVSDISMPLLTGLEAMKELKNNGLDIPFVLMSTNCFGSEEYLQAGAMAFLPKTKVLDELISAVDAAGAGRVFFPSIAQPPFALTLNNNA